MDVLIRPESAGDYDKIDDVIESAFNQKNEAGLVRKLRTTEKFNPVLSLVASAGDEVIGQILFYPVEIEAGKALILAPMCVKPEMQRRGVGGKLVREGLKKALEQGYDSVIVVGHPEYYPRFGFKPASGWKIRLAFDVPDEAFMAIELTKGSLDGREGVVELPQPYMVC